ncbi:MAG: AI-2E family transporter [Flavobacteriales bacterium]|jgi:predicted PurR-regulated permease PerM|nr:AI-2E family transporter [Flavobacteriales bacterium]NCG29171.1 AI-2E family transporter [Bacteroidota bacterium]MBT3964558.1 AI-2E family transporter [Flavobacteriales bacterium]MBT4704628.1 AI-2E family transporter [Flavobacteriales bacterium]MBT4930801.1 AI-2E family transporter [Flavobacteriales bacterium]
MFGDKPIDFNRFVRILFGIALVVLAYYLLDRLSTVLIPFFLAWLTAYLLEPINRFLHRWIKHRSLVVFTTLISILLLVSLAAIIFIPLMVDEVMVLQRLLSTQVSQLHWPEWLPRDIVDRAGEYLAKFDLTAILSQEGMTDKALHTLSGIWEAISGVMGVIAALFSVVTYVLYLIFIMIDYDRLSNSWEALIPEKQKSFVTELVSNLEAGMNGYFKAQSKIVLIVSILFAVGFKIIGLPFAIVLGLFVGLLNFVPYLQLVGFLPAIALIGLNSLETGESFWLMLGLTVAVFAIVQLLQDAVLTPKIMGEFSGLNPTIILLSLSIWGSLLGLMGLIIAIPMTSLLVAYYKKYVISS